MGKKQNSIGKNVIGYRPPTSHIRKAQKETNWKLNRNGLTKTEKEKEIETPAPKQIENVEKTHREVTVGNPLKNIKLMQAKEKKNKKKYSNDVKGMEYV